MGQATTCSAAPPSRSARRPEPARRADALYAAPRVRARCTPAPESPGPIPKASSPAHSLRASFGLKSPPIAAGHPARLAVQPVPASSSSGSGQLSRSRYPAVTISVTRRARVRRLRRGVPTQRRAGRGRATIARAQDRRSRGSDASVASSRVRVGFDTPIALECRWPVPTCAHAAATPDSGRPAAA